MPPLDDKAVARFRRWFRDADANACWPWLGAICPDGYGNFWLNGRQYRAHRISWQISHGAIPSGMLVCHSCDNPPCINPAHLWLGTAQENNADREAKGRTRRGEETKARDAALLLEQGARRAMLLGSRTHCPRGHAYAGQRIYPSETTRGTLRCRICHNALGKVARAARREKAGLPPEGSGSKHNAFNATLTAEQALAAYRSPAPAKEIAALYGVSVSAIYNIRSGARWAHLTGHRRLAA